MIQTGGESPQSWLGDMQTFEITLALAYMLCYLTATWSQL